VLIERDELCGLIPHAGNMCLLDGVLSWDDENITCTSERHLRQDNPLRTEEGLSAVNGIEFGAQAMAVHGGLLARVQGESIPPGYLVAIRQCTLARNWLHDLDGPLTVRAKRLMGQGGQFIYQLEISDGASEILSARATVMAQTEKQES
jgi:predicted hotdog family 3-hydroxylacyl-ACP dehydratase